MSTAVNLFGPTELAQTQTTIGTTYFGETETELLKQILVAVANRSGGGGTGGAITGEGKLWFTATAPTGWLLCDGSAVSRTTYADLFAVIGTTYGAGDGTTFNLPNFSNRVPVGYSGVSPFDTLGTQVGNVDSTIPDLSVSKSFVSTTSSDINMVESVNYSGSTSISVVQPSLVVNFIIKT